MPISQILSQKIMQQKTESLTNKPITKSPLQQTLGTIQDKPDYLYRSGVGIMLINKKKQIFVGKRIDNHSDAWQMPQGGLDSGESEEEAMFRELKEETGEPM